MRVAKTPTRATARVSRRNRGRKGRDYYLPIGTPGIQGAPAMRRKVSLDGTWKFCPAFPELESNQRFMEPGFDPDAPRPEEDRRDVGWIEPEFPDDVWLDIKVPHSWNKAVPELWSYEGIGWYRRQIQIPDDWEGMRVEFHCESANYKTTLYVNGELAGTHEGGYTPFAIPVHDQLRYGQANTLAISVDNLPKPDRCPGGEYGWWNYGGLYRSTYLLAMEQVHIYTARVTTQTRDGLSRVLIRARAWAGDDPGAYMIRAVLADDGGNTVAEGSSGLAAGREGAEVEIHMDVRDARLWSPEHPCLYHLNLALIEIATGHVKDTRACNVGIRSITVDGGKLLLNGSPLLVKGVNRHPEYPLVGHTESESDLIKDLLLVKSLGANAMRCHYPYSPRTFDLCDEMGVMVLCEVPLYQWGRPEVKADSPEALQAAKSQLREMIDSYANHPSVFMWSVSNENMTKPRRDTEEYRRLTEMTVAGNIELVELAHELDPTRPVVEVSNCWPGDPVLERTDLCAVNMYIGAKTPHLSTLQSLSDRMHERLEELRDEHPDKPILIGEFGSWAIPGLMTDYFPGEEYQAALITNYWRCMMEESNVVGGFIWVFQDSDEHRRFEWDYELRIAYGLFTLDRRPKRSVEAVRRLWLSQS